MSRDVGDAGRERGGRTLLAAATSGNFAQFGARVVVSPFVLVLAATFSVSKGAIGAGLTAMWAAFALMQFPSGVLADVYGERPVILASMGLTVLGSALVALAPTFAVFVAALVALGIGTGLYFAVGTALLARRTAGPGRAFGVHSAGAPLSGLALPVVATAVAARYGWRSGVGVGGVVAGLALVFIAVAVSDTPPTAPGASVARRLHPRTLLARLARPDVGYTTAVAVLAMYCFQSFVSFFPTFLQEYHGFGEAGASLAFGLAFAVIAVGLPVVGSLADERGTTLGLAVPFAITAVGIGVLLAVGTTAAVYLGVVLTGVGLTWGGSLQSRFMAQFDAAERASGFGTVRTVYVLLGSVGNVATGALAESAGWPVAYGVVAAMMVVAAGLVVARSAVGPPVRGG